MEQVSEGSPAAQEEIAVDESSPSNAEDVPVSKEAPVATDEAPVGDETEESPKDEQTCSSDDPDKEAHRRLSFLDSHKDRTDITFKILVLGNTFVGKSSFLLNLCTGRCGENYTPTVGVDFYNRLIHYEGKNVCVQLWDTAGAERFQSVTTAYYRNSHGVILMYDVTNESSFDAVRTWVNSIQENTEDSSPSVLLLVGNKIDLESERIITTEMGEEMAKRYNAEFLEMSAKTGYNVGNACIAMIRRLLKEGVKGAERNHRLSVLPPNPKPSCKC